MRAGLSWIFFVALVGGATWSSGCSSSGSSGALPACKQAPGLASIDASSITTAECSAARAYVSCSFANGGGEGCLSNDPSTCPANGPAGGSSSGSCKDVCAPNEYGVACGGPGSGPTPQPPAGCRSAAGANPGGVGFFCCPCL